MSDRHTDGDWMPAREASALLDLTLGGNRGRGLLLSRWRDGLIAVRGFGTSAKRMMKLEPWMADHGLDWDTGDLMKPGRVIDEVYAASVEFSRAGVEALAGIAAIPTADGLEAPQNSSRLKARKRVGAHGYPVARATLLLTGTDPHNLTAMRAKDLGAVVREMYLNAGIEPPCDRDCAALGTGIRDAISKARQTDR